MIGFKRLILAACFVTALGLYTKRQGFASTDGFLCALICQNRPNITGRTAKCLITHKEKVHITLVRELDETWRFYAVDDIDIEEDKLCEEVIAGDAFLKNETKTICPSSVEYAKHHHIVGLRKDKDVESPASDTSYRNDNSDMKTLIVELDTAVNKVFEGTGVTTRRFARMDKGANAVARKVVETMNHLKKEVGLLDFGGNDSTSINSPPNDTKDDYQKENRAEPLDREKGCNTSSKGTNQRSDDDYTAKEHSSKDDYDVADWVNTLVKMVKDVLEIFDSEFSTPFKRMNKHPSSNNKIHEISDNSKYDDWPTLPSVPKYRGDDSSKDGLSYIAPPTSPPYNPPGYRQEDGDSSTKKESSYIAPPTSPPYNPPGYRQDDCDSSTKKDFSNIAPPTSPPYNPPGYRQENGDSSTKKEFSYIAPPTSPPYNPPGYRQEDSDSSTKKEFSYIAPPTSPPYNPPGFRQQGDDSPINKKKSSYIAPPTSPPYNPPGCKQEDGDSSTKKDLSYIAPPTSPPYNPPGYRQEDGDSSTKKESSYIAPPTSPPYNPPGFRRQHTAENYDEKDKAPPTSPPYTPNHEHAPEEYHDADDWQNHPHSIRKRSETKDPKYSPPLKGRNDFIRSVRKTLEELKNEYKRSNEENLKEIVENLHEEISQMEKTKKRTDTPPESAYPLLLSPIVEAVAESIDSVKRNSHDTEETLKAKYHPHEFNTMDALCGLMTTQVCARTNLLYCSKDDTCCWAYIDESTCSDAIYDSFKNCYAGLSNILDSLMT